jgi:hypothetical protein
MLDNPEKALQLVAALKAAVPFEVELSPGLIAHLRMEKRTVDQGRQTVSDLSYAGDEGGIMCHLARSTGQRGLYVSLTHINVPRSMPLARAVTAYQKHRTKKLRQLARMRESDIA